MTTVPAHRRLYDCEAVHGYPQCIGCAVNGAPACTCDTLTPAQHQLCLADAREAERKRRGRMCHDCAFRPGSPEWERRAEIGDDPFPFRCHQGMPIDFRGREPASEDEHDYKPRKHVYDYPICAGWKKWREKRGGR